MTDDLANARRSAAGAVTSLQAHLEVLLTCADVLASHGAEAASRELRRIVMRALVAVHVLNQGLGCIEMIERHLCETGANLWMQQVAAVHVADSSRILSASRHEAEMSKLGRLGDAAGVTQPGQAGADRPEHAEGFVVSDGEERAIRDKERES